MFASDPIEQYVNAASRARAQGLDTAPAALATASTSAAPSVRIVLIRGVDARGFVFFTNYNSRKARELTENPRAALCQHWLAVEEQVRVEGRVELADPAESDAYFKGRPRDSQIGAWASDQSATLDSRARLEERIADVEARFGDGPVARPPFWGGFRIIPARVEFWYGRPGRLHERLLYERVGQGFSPDDWKTSWLYP